jgi:hypothetical protein
MTLEEAFASREANFKFQLLIEDEEVWEPIEEKVRT